MKRFLNVVAFGFTLVAVVMIILDQGAMTAIYDGRRPALIASLVAAALHAVSLRSRRSARAGLVAALLVAAVVVANFFLIREEEVRFTSSDTTLAATLYVPRGEGVFPVVVGIHGSGPSERRYFRWHGRLFARNEIAFLAPDKRGSGESGGETYSGGYDLYAEDVEAAVRFLRTRDDIDPRAVGLLGHSEGGWVAPLASARLEPRPVFIIVISTTSLTPAEQVIYESIGSVRAEGYSEATVTEVVELQRRLMSFQRTGVADRQLATDLERASREPWFEASELDARLGQAEDYAWWRSVMDYDPLVQWARVKSPVLAISGGLDRNSDVRQSQREIAAALARNGNRDFTGVIYPRMVHGGVEWWLPGRIPPPRFPPGLGELLVDWTRKAIGRQGAGVRPDE